jgi:hypothetical protein
MKIKNSNLTWWDDLKEKIDAISFPIAFLTALIIRTILAIASIIIVLISIIMVIKAITN